MPRDRSAHHWRRLALAGLAALLLGGCVVGTQEDAATSSDEAFGVAGSTPANGTALVDVSTARVEVEFTTDLATSYSAFTAVSEQVAALLTLEDVTDEDAPLPVRYRMEYIVSLQTLRLTLEQPLVWAHVYRLTLDAMFSAYTGATLGSDVLVTFTAEPMAFDGEVFADRVVVYAPVLPTGEADGAGYFIPQAALGPPRGAKHVASLGFDKISLTEGGFLVLGFGDGTERRCIVNDDGTDFTVVENAAPFQGSSNVFTEAAYVEVSENGTDFHRFPATPPVDPADVGLPAAWSGFAGIHVYDPETSTGGDEFDLADVIVAAGLPADFQACYVKIVDAGAGVPDAAFPVLLISPDKGTGADIDAVLVPAGHSVAAPGLTD
ncbi:MAG: hypothetical protein HY342_04450 [Candidatus Lambdaproteobacteria bacterium]|nr:hypothetical protein [Candidatus Lambdaproteobacteria bacterium]